MSHPIVSHHTPPCLPGELTDRIVDFLHDDWRALACCALTAGPAHSYTPLAPSARYHLSRTIVLQVSGSYAELLDFLKTFPARSPLAELIHSIHIRGPPVGEYEAPHASFPVLIDLSHYPHLRAVALSHLFVEAPARFVRFLCRLPALEELTCVGLAPKATAQGGLRLVPDIGPDENEIRGFCRQLRVLRIVDVEWLCLRERDAGARTAPDALLKILEHGRERGYGATPREVDLRVDDVVRRSRWIAALCHDNTNLQHTDATLYEAIGSTETSASGTVTWDKASQEFLTYAPQLLSQPSLVIRYDPWRTSSLELSTSETIDAFLDLFSGLTRPRPLHDTPERTAPATEYNSALESLELALMIPLDARASDASWTALFRSLRSECWPKLTRVKITLESPKTPILRALEGLSLEDRGDVDAVEMYAYAVRGVLAALADELDLHPEVEVAVRAPTPLDQSV